MRGLGTKIVTCYKQGPQVDKHKFKHIKYMKTFTNMVINGLKTFKSMNMFRVMRFHGRCGS